MADEEYERFEITDHDLESEFNPNRRSRRPTKNQQIYGIWADDDSENELEEGSRRGGRGGGKKTKDYSAPIGFVAGGIQQAGKKKEEKKEKSEDEEEDDERPQFGGRKVSGTSSESEQEDARDIRSMAGFRKAGGGFQQKGGPVGKAVGGWEQHTKGIGAKLLLQMGYQPGKGLGKDLQGIAAPIQAHLRKGRGAIGAYGPEKKTVVMDQKAPKEAGGSKKEDLKELTESGQQWRKEKHKGRYFYKSVE